MCRSAFLDIAPVELDAFIERLMIHDRKMQGYTAQLLSMLANCHLNREASDKPDGWSPTDFMPDERGQYKKPEMSLAEFARAFETGELSEPATEEEIAEIKKVNQQMKDYLKNKADVVGKVTLVPIQR